MGEGVPCYRTEVETEQTCILSFIRALQCGNAVELCFKCCNMKEGNRGKSDQKDTRHMKKYRNGGECRNS